MKFAGKGKLKIEITCMKARYKILIIFLQLFAFFSYIGCFVYLTYKADKELIFIDIPVKYTKGAITGKEYGITITKDRGSHTIHLESNKFPDKHFKAHYYMSFPYPQRSFDSIIESHPKTLQCYLEPDFREKQGKYTPFVYSGQREKSSVYYLNLVSYVKYEYGFFMDFPINFYSFDVSFHRKNKIKNITCSNAFKYDIFYPYIN